MAGDYQWAASRSTPDRRAPVIRPVVVWRHGLAMRIRPPKAVQAQTRAAPRTRHQSAPFTSSSTRAILAGLPRHALHVLGGLLAQSVEQRTFNPLVTGSSPVQPTKCRVSIEVLGLLAQLVEQRTLNPLVEGSNPSGPTNIFEGLIVQTIRPFDFCASLRFSPRFTDVPAKSTTRGARICPCGYCSCSLQRRLPGCRPNQDLWRCVVKCRRRRLRSRSNPRSTSRVCDRWSGSAR